MAPARGLRDAEGERARIWSSPSTAARRPTRRWPMRRPIGLKVVVIDHHLMREQPPACAAVVNPNRPGCTSGQGNLAAAGVVFVLLAALNREARARGLFAERAEPDLRQWLDLAAHGRHLRRDRPDRLQPGAGGAGAEGDVGLAQSGAEGAAGRGGDGAGAGQGHPRGLHPGAANQRRRAHRPLGPGRAPAVHRRSRRGRAHSPPSWTP